MAALGSIDGQPDELHPATQVMGERIAAGLREQQARRQPVRFQLIRPDQYLRHIDDPFTAHVLGKLCAAYGLTMSRLMRMVEEDFIPLVRHSEQMVWSDASVGFRRRSISPPAQPLAGEALECELVPGALSPMTYRRAPGSSTT